MQQQYVQQESGQYESIKKEVNNRNWKDIQKMIKKVNDFVLVFVIFHTYSLIK